ncbi:MAG: hypothetical protein ACOYLH_01110 [Flavobacteriales bacterium]
MLEKIKNLSAAVHRIDQNQQKLNAQLAELQWADVYHDSIRGRAWLENLPLNVGRWAGGYAFFYVLNRLMGDYKPSSVIEFGLGESSKFISRYIENELTATKHTIVEHDPEWVNAFKSRFSLSNQSSIEVFELQEKTYNNERYLGYKNIESITSVKHELYIVDGPFGTDHYSRFDIRYFLDVLVPGDEFLIIVDDSQRQGEQDTYKELRKYLTDRGFQIHYYTYRGGKNLSVIGTGKYKFAMSL